MAEKYKLYIVVVPPEDLVEALAMIRYGIIEKHGPTYYNGIERLYKAIEKIINEDGVMYINNLLAVFKVLCALRETADHILLELRDSPNMASAYEELISNISKYERLVKELLDRYVSNYNIYGWCPGKQEQYRFLAFMLGQTDTLEFYTFIFLQ